MKNAKKILLVLLAIVALTLVMSISIFAEEPTYKADTVAVVNGVEYNSFDSAYNATPAGGTLKLVKGVTMVTKTFDKAITLDFNGQTMTFTNGFAGINLKHSGVVFTSSAATRGKILYTGRNTAIKVWDADKIENIDIECSYDYTKATNGVKQIGGIVMQEGKTHINTIQNVDIYGVGLTQGIQAHNCGGYLNDDGTPFLVINTVKNVKINATNDSAVKEAYGMNIYAPVGTVEDCEIYGKQAGIFIWSKDSYNATMNLVNCEVGGEEVAVRIDSKNAGANIEFTADANTSFESESGVIFNNASSQYGETPEFTVPGYEMTEDGTIGSKACETHNYVEVSRTNATCTAKGSITYKCSACSENKIDEIPATGHNYAETNRVEAQPGVAGSITETCKNCGDVKTTEIPALPVRQPQTFEVGTKDAFINAVDSGKDNQKTPTVNGVEVVDGDTIRLTANIDVGTSYFYIKRGITIDLNGYILTTQFASCSIRLQNDGASIISSRLNPETGKQGKIVYTNANAAIKVWNADRIENIDIECTYDPAVANKTITGIAMQESGTTHINSIKNVNIYGQGLTQGIETFRCGGGTTVIDSIDGVTVVATNNKLSGAYALVINAPVGTVSNCEFYGETAGVYAWSVYPYTTTVTFEENVKISGGDSAVLLKAQGGAPLTFTASEDTKYSSTSGVIFENNSVNSSLNLTIPGYVLNEDGTITCAGEHNYVETGRVDAQVGVEGSVTYTCSKCGDSYSETIEALPEQHTHTPVEIPAVAAGVNITGYTAGTKCSACGEILVKPMVIPATNFKIAARSLAIYETITVNYKCEIPAGYENVYMVFLFDNREITITEFEIEESSGRYVFAFTGVTPLFMNENIHATVYAEVDGQVVTNVYEQYSIKQYCVNQLAKNIAPELKTFLIDFMVYGEKAQIMMNHNTGNLVTDGVDVSGKSSFTELDASYDKRAITGTALDIAEWKTSTLYITNTVNMQFKFVSSDLTGLKIKVTIKDRTQEFNAIDLADTKDTNGRYIVTFANITAIEFNETVTATFWKDGVQIGQTMTYSVNSYIQRNQDLAGSTYATLVDFLKAMYLYGKSAYDLLY